MNISDKDGRRLFFEYPEFTDRQNLFISSHIILKLSEQLFRFYLFIYLVLGIWGLNPGSCICLGKHSLTDLYTQVQVFRFKKLVFAFVLSLAQVSVWLFFFPLKKPRNRNSTSSENMKRLKALLSLVTSRESPKIL